MHLSNQRKLDWIKVGTITIAYVLFTIFLNLLIRVVIEGAVGGELPKQFRFRLSLVGSMLTGLGAGLLLGYIFVQVNKRLFRTNSLGMALLKTAGAYAFVFLIVSGAMSLVESVDQLNPNATVQEIMTHASTTFLAPAALVFFVLWGFISLMTLFMLQVYDKFGPGIMMKFITGQYFHPKEETRIFMFLDMRSSTSVAEQIGNEAYFLLLRDCIALLTPAIIESQGEIFQYVGDEIVISWSPKRGFKNSNCLRCYDDIQKRLNAAAPVFTNKYGLAPKFKAGLHSGLVIAGEIGEIKKDIVYSGDVLNTTARIQGLCNEYNEDFLASSDALSQMTEHKMFSFIPIGDIELRGRQSRVAIQAVRLSV